MNDKLLELARAYGVILEYYDIWGQQHHTGEHALRSVLQAMGIEAADDAAVEASLTRTQQARWARVLPPATVVRRDASPWTIRLQLPAASLGDELAWTVREEDGDRHEGRLQPASLHSIERVSVAGCDYVALEWRLAFELPFGYHHVRVRHGEADSTEMRTDMLLAVTPERCYCPPALQGEGRVWGATCQLYGVRSERNWGIGDFTDLMTLVQQWGTRGGGVIGLNPLHALYPHNPAHASPYSPSSRLFKNWIYIDVEACADFHASEEARALVRSAVFQTRLKSLREAELLDYPAVAAAKRQVLDLLYAYFRKHHIERGTEHARRFRGFQAEGGEALRRHALFDALQESLSRESTDVWGWPVWPQAFRDPASEAVAAFCAERLDRVEFFEYLQWQVDIQYGAAARRSFELGLGVGIYEDLAVSIDRGGAEAWANQDIYATTAGVGAPPDDFAPNGQNWGLPPMIPHRLEARAYEPFIATLRANMRHSGALRIDHVMGLMRLFWVPPDGKAAEGAYVRYPFEDLLGLTALESERNRCLVIGEDLGTVPDEAREALARTGVLSYRLLYFERQPGGEFKSPRDYPAQAIVAASTHDLPTLAGWWEGRDLSLRSQLGLFPNEAMREAQIVGRAQDRARLLLALERENLLPQGVAPDPVAVPAMTPALSAAIHAYLAATPAKVMVLQLEDVAGSADQANLPGTTDQYPNWRRKLPLELERFLDEERFVRSAQTLATVRPRSHVLAQPRPQGAQAVIPRCTYRLQLHREFDFSRATALIPYLAALGVSHVYCSPYLRARAGSQHGYDIIDHAALNPEIGNRDDFEHFVAELKRHGMGQILDMVPNHMGVMGRDNAWWMDLLENGPASAYADYFDVDWRPIDPEFANRIVLPVLGDHYGAVLERAELRLEFEPAAGSFAVFYYEHRFPIDPREYPRILDRAVRSLGSGELDPDAQAGLESLIASLHHLPAREATEPEAIAERTRDKEVHKRRLGRMVASQPVLGEAIERSVRFINGANSEPDRFRALHELLDAQAYRLAYWRVAGDDINYRRFFDINDLAALRMENDAAFEATHRFVLELAAAGQVDGLRIDHPDGLFEPARYFRKLQERYIQLAFAAGSAPPPDAAARPLYVVVEKIIAPHEHLPESWPVYGTTGYRFANVVNGVFVDTEARERVHRAWKAFVGDESAAFIEACYRGKRIVLTSALAGELAVLSRRLLHLARADRRTRDYTVNTLQRAVTEVIGYFPVYRTYIADSISKQDRRYIEWAIGRAREHGRGADASVFDFLRSILLQQLPTDAPEALKAECRAITMRFQQLTSPVAAKGIEDTAFYNFNRLVSLNDVGGDPDQFGMRVSAFHGASADRAAKWPHTLLATSTHDNKRSEDVRARIDVISEMPAAWRLLVRRWSRLNRARKRNINGAVGPSRNDEYLLYQTLIGSFPADCTDEALAAYRGRIEGYMVKAAREAKVRTSWLNVNEPYEAALIEFVRGLLGRSTGNLFLDDLAAQARAFAWYGALNSLSMAVIKLTSPGVPDIFQGNETLDYSLVDPDNRRPVDYEHRLRMLAALQRMSARAGEKLGEAVRALVESAWDGRAKMWVVLRSLGLRRSSPELFSHGDYLPVKLTGAREQHALAYARRHGESGILVVCARMFASLGVDVGSAPVGAALWQDTVVDASMLPAGAELTDLITGARFQATDGRLDLGRVFDYFPGAILHYDTQAR
ncbi:MAG: malto-oligosyltrehalose synthase [Betaproteobacteria bacterium]|nr:malto-oligosyltrehalose synthase [Betaproteobacteria bacterium]